MTSAMSPTRLTVIRLELASGPETPCGSPQRGYVLVAPLDGAGQLDTEGWQSSRESCTATRFWDGTTTELGALNRHPNGDWALDEGVPLRFLTHTFRPGGSITVREADGTTRSFRVTSLRALA